MRALETCTLPFPAGPSYVFYCYWFTWIFATFVSLDEAYDKKHQDQESDGAHQSDKPALRGDVYLPVGGSWRKRRRGTGRGKEQMESVRTTD